MLPLCQYHPSCSYSLDELFFFLSTYNNETEAKERKFDEKIDATFQATCLNSIIHFSLLANSFKQSEDERKEEFFNLVKKCKKEFRFPRSFPSSFLNIGFTASTSNRHLIDAMLGYDTFGFKVFWCS